MLNIPRLLGFAFTNADFLFEMDAAGTILFAAGAAHDLAGGHGDTLIGKPAAALFKGTEAEKFAAITVALKSGQRAGPYTLTLATGEDANLAMFRLPQNGANISCTLAWPEHTAAQTREAKTGLSTREDFLAAVEKAGVQDSLTLINVPGLPDLCAQLPAGKSEALMERIGESLRKAGASATGRISETGFGAVTPRGELNLAIRVREAVAVDCINPPDIAEMQLGLEGAKLTPEQRLLSIRYVIGQFAESGKVEAPGGDIAGAFAGMMEDTEKRLAHITRTVAEGAFEIAYQPIRDLDSGRISHYEALARFNQAQGTAETIKFMEALGIANAFDLAVAKKVLDVLERNNSLRIAFNISGATIASSASFGVLAAMLGKRSKLASRALIEITETAAITDLEAAGRAIASLRAMGYRVGLDDFGAGAASINYLHAFQVDFVKFDGALIKKIGSSKRDDRLLAGLAKLCGEMSVATIAEWIESEAMAKTALAMGFQQGQGKWLGAPLKELPQTPAPVGKRQGVKESWG